MAHTAALFDINECGFDWIIDKNKREEYISLLCNNAVKELPDLLRDQYNPNTDYSELLKTIHSRLRQCLAERGRYDPNSALEWWESIEHGSVTHLREDYLLFAPLSIELARAFLSAQASSVSVERLFGDAGFREGMRSHHIDDSMQEMMLTIRNAVKFHINHSKNQRGFLSGSAESVKDFSKKIAYNINKSWCEYTHCW